MRKSLNSPPMSIPVEEEQGGTAGGRKKGQHRESRRREGEMTGTVGVIKEYFIACHD